MRASKILIYTITHRWLKLTSLIITVTYYIITSYTYILIFIFGTKDMSNMFYAILFYNFSSLMFLVQAQSYTKNI